MTLRILPQHLSPVQQSALLSDLDAVIAAAPFYGPSMPRTAKPLSVMMTNCGPLGWVTDVAGYRYQATHPATGVPWPPMPAALVALWRAVADYPADPESCLINWYAPGARMGLHQDISEEALDAPVVSVSLGDTAVFRIGGLARRDPTRSVRLASGDVVVFGGADRLVYHGIDRIIAGTSGLLAEGGRFNLTLRRVYPPRGPG